MKMHSSTHENQESYSFLKSWTINSKPHNVTEIIISIIQFQLTEQNMMLFIISL